MLGGGGVVGNKVALPLTCSEECCLRSGPQHSAHGRYWVNAVF